MGHKETRLTLTGEKKGNYAMGLQYKRVLAVVIAVGIVALAGSITRAHGSGGQPAANTRFLPNNPAMQNCVRSKARFCYPDVEQTAVARNPADGPPSTKPHYISEDQAVAIARDVARMGSSGPAPQSAKVIAQLMAGTEAPEHNGGANLERKVWVVTIHADMWTMGGPAAPAVLKHVYTVDIDAETGTVTDYCIGCASLG